MALWTIDLIIRFLLSLGFIPGQLGWIMQADLPYHTPVGLLTYIRQKAYDAGFGDQNKEKLASQILPGDTPLQGKAFLQYWKDASDLTVENILPLLTILEDPSCLWWRHELDAVTIKELNEWFWDNTPNMLHPVQMFSSQCPCRWLSLLVTDGWSLIPDDLKLVDWRTVDITVIAAMCSLLGPEIMTQEVLDHIRHQGSITTTKYDLTHLRWNGSENEIYQIFAAEPEYRKLLEHLGVAGSHLKSGTWDGLRSIMEYLETPETTQDE